MCTLPSIPFSTYIKEPVNSNRTYKTGERIKLECKKGFKKQPGGNPIRICISGQWTQFPFKCEGKFTNTIAFFFTYLTLKGFSLLLSIFTIP